MNNREKVYVRMANRKKYIKNNKKVRNENLQRKRIRKVE